MKESMDLRRCGSSGGVGDADEFCAKDKVACARVTAANSKILGILTEHPFRNICGSSTSRIVAPGVDHDKGD